MRTPMASARSERLKRRIIIGWPPAVRFLQLCGSSCVRPAARQQAFGILAVDRAQVVLTEAVGVEADDGGLADPERRVGAEQQLRDVDELQRRGEAGRMRAQRNVVVKP